MIYKRESANLFHKWFTKACPYRARAWCNRTLDHCSNSCFRDVVYCCQCYHCRKRHVAAHLHQTPQQPPSLARFVANGSAGRANANWQLSTSVYQIFHGGEAMKIGYTIWRARAENIACCCWKMCTFAGMSYEVREMSSCWGEQCGDFVLVVCHVWLVSEGCQLTLCNASWARGLTYSFELWTALDCPVACDASAA